MTNFKLDALRPWTVFLEFVWVSTYKLSHGTFVDVGVSIHPLVILPQTPEIRWRIIKNSLKNSSLAVDVLLSSRPPAW